MKSRSTKKQENVILIKNRGDQVQYRIEYAGGRCSNIASSRKDLLEWLRLLKDETISDIRKLYKSGVSDSVLDKYRQYIKG